MFLLSHGIDGILIKRGNLGEIIQIVLLLRGEATVPRQKPRKLSAAGKKRRGLFVPLSVRGRACAKVNPCAEERNDCSFPKTFRYEPIRGFYLHGEAIIWLGGK